MSFKATSLPFGQDPAAQLPPVLSLGRALDRPVSPCFLKSATSPNGLQESRGSVYWFRPYTVLDLSHENLSVSPEAEKLAPACAINPPSHPSARCFAIVLRFEFIGHLSLRWLVGIHCRRALHRRRGSTFLPYPSAVVTWADFNHLSGIHAFAISTFMRQISTHSN